MARILISIEEDKWEVLRETLEMDSQSGAFELALQEQIIEALSDVEELKPKVMIEVKGGLVQSVTATIPLDLYILDYDNLESDPDAAEDSAEPCGLDDIVSEEKIMELIKENLADFKEEE